VGRVPAEDPALSLAVDFLNTYDSYNVPPELLSIERVRRLTAHHGHPRLGLDLREGDVAALRAMRERLRPAFASPDPAEKIRALDEVLAEQATGARLRGDPDGLPRLAAAGGRDPVGRLAVTVADALAHALATGGPERLRTCAGDPCRCVYVDRTRAGRQRYCCQLCNDRMAAAAYRQRRRSG